MYQLENSTSQTAVDTNVLSVSKVGVRWYAQSPDLHILFNTRCMSRNNPLLALGQYGSLCWRGVLAGWQVGRIRAAARSAFGKDEVIPFMQRLMDVGFLDFDDDVARASCPAERIVKELPAPEVQFQLAHAAVPWYCLWEINTRCNLRCKVCYLPHFSGAGPDSKHWKHLAQQIIDAGIFYVCLLGGEPLLRGDLEEIVGELRGAHVFVKIITNGLLLSRQRAAKLAAVGLNQIEVSFDGLTEARHEDSRGRGTFQQAVHALHHAFHAKIPRVAVVWTLHSDNKDELDRLPSFLTRLRVRECYVSPFKKTGLHGSAAPFHPPNSDDLNNVRECLSTWRDAFPELTITLLPGCSCGRTSVVIGDEGDVRLCSFSYTSVGNVFSTPLSRIWRSLGQELPATGPAGYCTRKA